MARLQFLASSTSQGYGADPMTNVRLLVRRVSHARLLAATTLLLTACNPASDSGGDAGDLPAAPKPAEVLVFPESVRTADASVNEFVTRAMSACAKGNYEAFRVLWSARETPLPRDEFEQGWNAARRIEVRALQKGLLEPDPEAGRETAETVYALLAEVALDPTLRAGKKEPLREVVLMLTREHDEWRIAKAPKPMREWVKENLKEKSLLPATTDESRP